MLFPRNAGTHLPELKVSQLKRPHYKSSPQWKPQILYTDLYSWSTNYKSPQFHTSQIKNIFKPVKGNFIYPLYFNTQSTFYWTSVMWVAPKLCFHEVLGQNVILKISKHVNSSCHFLRSLTQHQDSTRAGAAVAGICSPLPSTYYHYHYLPSVLASTLPNNQP